VRRAARPAKRQSPGLRLECNLVATGEGCDARHLLSVRAVWVKNIWPRSISTLGCEVSRQWIMVVSV
jgi:hypothetical protein